MKKTIILSAIALALVTTTMANENPFTLDNYKIENVKSYDVNTFCLSIVKGDTEMVKKLISLGEDVNKKSNGLTPLMYAAKFNKVEIMKILIANGANLKSKSTKGYSVMKYAKLSKATDAILLLEQIVSKNRKNKRRS